MHFEEETWQPRERSGSSRTGNHLQYVRMRTGCKRSQPSNPEPSPSGEYADQNESLSADIDEKSDSNDATYTLDEVSTTKDMLFIEHNGVCTALQGDYSFQERASKWTDADGEDVTDSTVAMYSGERGGEHTV